jgi:hypothetical protein
MKLIFWPSLFGIVGGALTAWWLGASWWVVVVAAWAGGLIIRGLIK